MVTVPANKAMVIERLTNSAKVVECPADVVEMVEGTADADEVVKGPDDEVDTVRSIVVIFTHSGIAAAGGAVAVQVLFCDNEVTETNARQYVLVVG